MNITNSIERQRYHDLESFYHVICWVSLMHARHGLDGTSLLDILRQIFDCAVKVKGTVKASYTKKSYMRANDLTHETKFQNEPLACLLKALGRKFRHLYITGPERRDEESERAQARYAEDLKEHEEALMKIKLDREPMWAEDLFMEAIRQPDSKWGDISHYCHTLPPSRFCRREIHGHEDFQPYFF
ncbi:hypothetical protein GALMADRAFT_491327 [Galerina marginata CBS 339.88]|uniref:Fungal-type protein kinase domain-containing protein n=1 Tax=Galerina marginata (strain CBS 339.88) TaxID=685588 RepID=A0A067T6T1_GALM3|nr:hypothetical protein GALMADRAFT_491327 [Galerina marginata CBS 339.88]